MKRIDKIECIVDEFQGSDVHEIVPHEVV